LRDLYAFAARQHACVTAAQLAAAGCSARTIGRLVADGVLRRKHKGVYVLGPVEPPLARYAAALLAVRDGVLSHHAAAAVYEILPPPGEIDVTTTARGPRSRQGIRVHLATRLPPSAVRLHHRLRLTSPERTLRDLAKTRHPQLERAAAEAHARRLVTARTLDAIVGTHDPAFTRSEAERRLLALVRAADLPPPRTNARLGPYEVDFLWPEQRLIVEVDGFAFHSSRAAFERDRARDADLHARGYRVIRVTWHQIARAPHVVVARLAAALALAAA
jgi:very-short-patch-repair endonuclease